ncbi:MAG: ATP-binding cassette domain-containing protein [Deltaproteobacteria bacterium]|nr:ATP-binding cassette domain-containing protein [Deltaproteobacteria bacterium]
MAIIGPSGCGKTTLLYMLSGLMGPTKGKVTIRGKAVKGPRKDVAFILQDFGLLPWRTVLQNVCLGMKIRDVPKQEQASRAKRLLADLGLDQHRDCYPASLSEGLLPWGSTDLQMLL